MKRFNKSLIFISLLFSILMFLPEKSFSLEDTTYVREKIKSAQDKTISLENAVKIIDEAINAADRIKFYQGKADALHTKGRIYLKIGDYHFALEAFWQELSLRENNPKWENSSLSNVYAYIGESYRAIGSFDLAISHLEKALEQGQKENDKSQVALSYNRLAAVYHEMSYRVPDTAYSYKAIEYANKSLEIYKGSNVSGSIISNYEIIGAAYNFQASYNPALKYLFLALDYADKDTTYQDKANIYGNIASVYNFKKEYDSAIRYASMGIDMAEKQGIKVYILSNGRQLTTAYIGKGDFKKAYYYIEKSNAINSQLYDEKKTSEIYGLQKKHEMEMNKKEEDTKTTKLKVMWISVIIIILIIGIGLYMRHRQLISINKTLGKNNKQISEQKEELMRSNAAKDKFFSILSHDIRNPLNGILGFAEILESDYDKIEDDEKKEYIGYLKTSSESLYKLIDRVLIWSRLQSGRIEIEKEKIELKSTGLAAIELQKVNAIRKGIILEDKLEDNIFVNADKNVLDTVFRNLLDNATKFTDAGGRVEVISRREGEKALVSISDTGVGISKEDIEKMFHIDTKVTSKGTAGEEGTGLGLTLCKDMLILMGSNLRVESEKGKGSRFYFELDII